MLMSILKRAGAGQGWTTYFQATDDTRGLGGPIGIVSNATAARDQAGPGTITNGSATTRLNQAGRQHHQGKLLHYISSYQ